jgi:hypothetical protein
MLRKLFWLTLALFPLLAALAIYELHDVAVWKSLLAAGMPVAIVDGLRDEAWWIILGLVAAHYAFFTLLPLFDPTLGWMKKGLWVVANFLLYPITPPLYTLLRTRDTPVVRSSALPKRRR